MLHVRCRCFGLFFAALLMIKKYLNLFSWTSFQILFDEKVIKVKSECKDICGSQLLI